MSDQIILEKTHELPVKNYSFFTQNLTLSAIHHEKKKKKKKDR